MAAVTTMNTGLLSNYTPSLENENRTSGEGAILMSDYTKIIVTVFYACTIVVGIGGNVMVCIIVLTQKRMRTVTNYFIVSLAISDIAMATLCIPFSFIANILLSYWPFGDFFCPIYLFTQVCASVCFYSLLT